MAYQRGPNHLDRRLHFCSIGPASPRYPDPMPPVLRGLLEAALYVTDLSRAIAFYRSVLCLKLLGECDAERGAAFAIGDSVLLLFRVEDARRGGDLPPHGAVGAGHVAFAI